MNIHKLFFSLALFAAFAFTLHVTSMSQENTTFDFNKEGLEEVTHKLLNAVQRYIPTALKQNGIKKTSNAKALITNAIQKALRDTDTPKALNNPNAEQIAAFTQQLTRGFEKALKELYTMPADLGWCSCPNAPESMRIALILQVVNDARKTRNPASRLVYTSIASGEMLLDYLIISELIEYGFKDIQVNFIELGLLDVPEIQSIIKKADDAKNEADLAIYEQMMDPNMDPYFEAEHNDTWNNAYDRQAHAENLLDNALKFQDHLMAFKNKLDAQAAGNAEITINHYTHVSDYLARAKQYPREKTDILILVDPSVDLYPLKDSIGAQAFAVQSGAIENFNEMDDTVVVFIPRTGAQDIKMYSNADLESLSYDDPFNLAFEWVSAVVYETQDVEKIQKDLSKPFDHTSFILRRVQQKFPQRVHRIQNPPKDNSSFERTETIFWLSDAYLVLQDIIREGLSDVDPSIYEISYPTALDDKPRLRKLDAEEYKTKDVITPYIGAGLDDYKLVSPSPEARKVPARKKKLTAAALASKKKAGAKASSLAGEAPASSQGSWETLSTKTYNPEQEVESDTSSTLGALQN